MVLELKIQIKGISKPPIWRKVLVPAEFTFHKLHLVIQNALGWGGGHLYSFTPSGLGSSPCIEQASDDPEYMDMDSKKTKISMLLNEKGNKFTYTYDFGDNWEHIITVEAVHPDKSKKATLISGKGKCPPDDCGGVWGYKDFLDAVTNPKHPEHEDMREWAGLYDGAIWDTSAFNLEAQARGVQELTDYGF